MLIRCSVFGTFLRAYNNCYIRSANIYCLQPFMNNSFLIVFVNRKMYKNIFFKKIHDFLLIILTRTLCRSEEILKKIPLRHNNSQNITLYLFHMCFYRLLKVIDITFICIRYDIYVAKWRYII